MQIITMSCTNGAGGIDRNNERLINKLVEKEWNVHHISPKGFDYSKYAKYPKFKYFPTKPFNNIFPAISFFPQALYRLFKIELKDKLIMSYNFDAGIIGALYKKFNKKAKLVVAVQGDVLNEIKIDENVPKLFMFLVLKMMSFAERFTLKNADVVVFVSHDMKKRFCSKYKIKESVVLHNSIDPNWKIKDIDIRKKYNLKNKKIIGFLGRLQKIKGLEYLINSFKILNVEIPNSVLLIAGKGPLKPKLEKLINRLKLEKNIKFLGWIKNPVSFINECDLIVLPSLHEGSPNTIQESFFCNTPIIASKTGGIPEILKHQELMFEPKDIVGISRLMIKILSDKKEYAKVKRLCEVQKRKFSYDWADKVELILKGVFNAS